MVLIQHIKRERELEFIQLMRAAIGAARVSLSAILKCALT